MGWIKKLHDERKKREFKLDLLYSLMSTTILMITINLGVIIVSNIINFNLIVVLGIVLIILFFSITMYLHFKIVKEIKALDRICLVIEGGGNRTKGTFK